MDSTTRRLKDLRTHPARFVPLACIPTYDPEAAARELRRAAKLGLREADFAISTDRVSVGQLLCLGLSLFVLSNCTSFEGGVKVSAGRRALLIEDYAEALPKFQKAAELEPGYVTRFTPFPENVWTYIGRSYYGKGDLTNARKALERSVEQHPDAILGRVYLGIVEMRQGEVVAGMADAGRGLKLLRRWFEVLDSASLYSCYWDPADRIRDGTASLVEQIETREVPWQEIASDLDWLGKEMEREIDLAARDIDLNSFRWCP